MPAISHCCDETPMTVSIFSDGSLMARLRSLLVASTIACFTGAGTVETAGEPEGG
jgi:hypothetical protein